MRAEKELAAQAAGTCVASPSGPKNPQAESWWLYGSNSTAQYSQCQTVTSRFVNGGALRVGLGVVSRLARCCGGTNDIRRSVVSDGDRQAPLLHWPMIAVLHHHASPTPQEIGERPFPSK
jgi:hypothetical protein